MGDPMELVYEGLQMQRRNIATNRAQREENKNRIICLVIMSSYHLSSYFHPMTARESRFGQNISAHLKDLT